MKNLFIESRSQGRMERSPEIDFNAESGILSITGESVLENPLRFYTPVVEWMREFVATFKHEIKLSIRLGYYNTSTSKNIYTLLEILSDHLKAGGKVKIDWYYKNYDSDTREEIEDIMLDLDLNINMISYIPNDEE